MSTNQTYSIKSLENFVSAVLIKLSGDVEQSKCVANILTWCDSIGRDTQGVYRLDNYINRIREGGINLPCKPEIILDSNSISIIDADRGFGQYAGRVGMLNAIDKARRFGAAMTWVRNSNHYGAGAYFVNLAANEQMLGMACSNSVPKQVPYGGVKKVMGTNPFAFGIPVKNGKHMLVDFSTATSAGSIIKKMAEKNGILPKGIAINESGKDIVDPWRILEGKGALMPFGGAKGYGIAIMVEVLSGILSDSGFSHSVNSMFNDPDKCGNNGHFFMVIDIKQLIDLDCYYSRIDEFIKIIKEAALDTNSNPVLYPGETRWDIFEKSNRIGIELDQDTLEKLKRLSDEFNIKI